MDTMLNAFATSTRILRVDALSGAALARAAFYLSGSPSSRVLVVRDPRPFPALDPALAELAALRPLSVLDRVVPNPRSEDVAAMVSAAKGAAAEAGAPPGLVIGIGGGSALDSAKALAFMLANSGDLDDYLGPSPRRKPETKGPKLLLIPTTTGTGSEVTRFGVYTMRSGRKATLASPFLQADAALLVAEAVADIPAALLAATA
jgi:alcohol dehydrogenase class IV